MKLQHCCREGCLQAVWQWSDFHLHSSPGGDKPVLRAGPETNTQGSHGTPGTGMNWH